MVFYSPDDAHIRLLLALARDHVAHGSRASRHPDDGQGLRSAAGHSPRGRLRRLRCRTRGRARPPRGVAPCRPTHRADVLHVSFDSRAGDGRRAVARRTPHRRRATLRRALSVRRSRTRRRPLSRRPGMRLSGEPGYSSDWHISPDSTAPTAPSSWKRRPAARRWRHRRLGELRRRDAEGDLRSPQRRLRPPAGPGAQARLRLARAAGGGGESRQRPPAPAAPPSARTARRVTTALSGVAVVAGFAAQALAPAAAPLFAAAMALGGASVARAAFYSLRARTVDMNVLMTLAALGAAAIGEWSEAALVMFLFALGNLLQALTIERTRRAVQALVALAPTEAAVLRDGVEQTVAVAESSRRATCVVVRPGERIPVDGIVVSGVASSTSRRSPASRCPVGRHDGDEVFAGSIVQGGSLQIRAIDDRRRHTIASDHPSGRRGTGRARAAAEHRRPLRRPVHAGRDRRRRGGGIDAAAGLRTAASTPGSTAAWRCSSSRAPAHW